MGTEGAARRVRARVLPAGALVLALCTTACGAGAAKAPAAARSSSVSGARRFALNPAEQAALEIVRLQPVVPFSPGQVKTLLPLLQGLQANPNQPPATLSQDGKTIEAAFTALQQEALKNMGSSTGPGGFGGRPGAGARRFSGVRRSAGPRFSRSGSGGGPGARGGGPAFIYQLAINTLEGKSTTFPGPPGAPGGPPASGSASGPSASA